jgi:Protein of unknown function (DUF1214)
VPGSLDLYFQNEGPGADKKANWPPAPRAPYNLTMRVYAPKSDALTGKWNPPAVVKVQTVPAAAQYRAQFDPDCRALGKSAFAAVDPSTGT